MKKSMFRDDQRFCYDSNANILDREIVDILTPLFKKYRDLEYSPREISHVMIHAIFEIELDDIIDWSSPINERS